LNGCFTYTLESVVDIELRNHGDEAKQIDKFHQGLQDKGIPALVFVIQERVDGITGQERVRQPGQVLESNGIVFRGIVFFFGALASVLVGQGGEELARAPDDFILQGLEYLPHFNQESHTLTHQNHPRRFLVVVQEIEEDDNLEKDVDNDTSDRDTSAVVLFLPKRNIYPPKKVSQSSNSLLI
jgi:hypothetical protein